MSRVRPALVTDAAAVVALHIASSADAYAPLAAVWPRPDRAKREAMWVATLCDKTGLLLVVEAHDAIVGFLHGGPARRTEPGTTLEIYAIHVSHFEPCKLHTIAQRPLARRSVAGGLRELRTASARAQGRLCMGGCA